MHRGTFALCAALCLVGCSSGSAAPPGQQKDAGVPGDAGQDAARDASHEKAALPDAGPLGGNRPVTPYVPASYDPSVPTPLVIVLHGYGASGALQELLFQFKSRAEKYGFIYLLPDGTVDSTNKRFWNATDACCNFDNTGVDDSAYIEGLIDEARSIYNIDAKRVFLVGHSNGAFMAYRMACDHADTIAAAVSLAGAMYSDVSKCNPSGPVSILQIHGSDDQTVLYDGGSVSGAASYPGAKTSVADWATFDGCATTPKSGTSLDLTDAQPGAETTVETYDGCQSGTVAALWTMQGEGHIPAINDTWRDDVIEFLLAHPKP